VSYIRVEDARADSGVDNAEGVRVITFDRPDARNALTAAMRVELCELLRAADADDACRAVVITGTDPAFTAGVDFKDAGAAATDGPGRAQPTVNPGQVLRALTTPVVCAVNGACVSGGLEIALSSTFIVASERAKFADTHALLNVVPTWGLTALLPRAVGLRKAREMSSTGVFVGAEEALRFGLVNHVVSHEELLPLAIRLAGLVAPTSAVGEILSLYDRGADLDLSGALALESAYTAQRRVSPGAFAEAGQALLADRRQQ
jgi:enoyl-CoA hydratase